jgi:hypothetical protein
MVVGAGSASWSAGKIGSALALTGSGATGFPGHGGFVTMGDQPGLNFDTIDSFTISAWIKTTAGLMQDSTIAGKMIQPTGGPFPAHYTGYELHFRPNSLLVWLINAFPAPGNYIEVSSTVLVNDGNWHQVAFTYNGSGQASGVKIYIDGVVDSATTVGHDTLSGFSLKNTVSFDIGSRNDGAYHNFTGSIDDVQVYHNVVTPAGMFSIFQNPGASIREAPLVSSIMPRVGHVRMIGRGEPATRYSVRSSTDLAPGSFIEIDNVATDVNGVWLFEDFSAEQFNTRFYRIEEYGSARAGKKFQSY